MYALLDFVTRMRAHHHGRDQGSVGALVVGVIIGIGLVVFGVIKFLIPGE